MLEYVRAKDIRERELMQLNAAQLERANELKEQELKDRRELSALQRELMRELQAKEIEVKLTEIQTLWDKDTWFSKLSRQETEQILLQQQHRLLILLSPPEISEDCPASFRNNLRTEMRSVGAFLNEHYSPQDSLSPVKFYSDYFNQPIADIDVERLQRILSPVPTIILYSDISDYAVTFRIGFWGVGNKEATVFSTKSWNWEEAYELLLEAGKSETQSFRIIRKLIVSIHNLLATFWADSYYLQLDPHYEPKLFSLSDELVGEGLAEEIIQPYLETLKELQKQQSYNYQQEKDNLISRFLENPINYTEKFKKIHTFEKLKVFIRTITFIPKTNTFLSGDVIDYYRHPKRKYTAKGTIILWDTYTKERKVLRSSLDSDLFSIAISSDSKLIAIDGQDNCIELINLETEQIFRTLRGHINTVFSLVFSPDGKLLASGSSDNTIKIWRVETGEEIYTFGTPYSGTPYSGTSTFLKLFSVAFSPDEPIIAGGNWKFFSVAFSPDGQIIAGGNKNGNAKLLELNNPKQAYTLCGHHDAVRSVAFSPDGHLLATGSADCRVKLWNVRTKKEFCTFTDHKDIVSSVSFSPNGQILASGSVDNTIKLWRVDTGELLRTLTCERAVLSIAFSSDGLTLAAGCRGGLIDIWRCEVGEE
uniref:WD40 repeat domain-containing protein n=1 Tax=Desertifilum tharense IPPAS B-1220 TaxID=1781255 RepID=A0ACD5GTI2_9CYAN